MSIENAKDSFYQLFVSETGAAGSFKKVERLTKCTVPSEAKVLDDITSTDDRRAVQVPVDFKESGELDFEYVLLPDDEGHKLIQKSFDESRELTFQIKFIQATGESRQFKGFISELSVDAEDIKKKIRKKGKISITGEVIKTLTAHTTN